MISNIKVILFQSDFGINREKESNILDNLNINNIHLNTK